MSYIGTKGGRVFRSSVFNSVRYTGDGTTTQYNLPETVVDDDAVLIHIDGVKQHAPAAYSTSGATLTFTGAPPSASAIEIILFGIGEVNIHTPTANSVGVSALKTSDGTAGQVLTTDGSGALSFSSKSTETLVSLGVTSTSAELNILDGVTSTAAELNILDGVTSTAAELNILDGVTSTAAELNILDGVTSTAAELNILDGVTSTAAELNILDCVTSTFDELNILDGVTSTAAELNILDGVTSTAAELNILDGVTASTIELNYVDGVTALIQTQLDAKVDDTQILTDVPSGALFTDTVYTHPTGAGDKHIPSGGASGNILTYSSSGTATWNAPAASGASDIDGLSDAVYHTNTYNLGLGLESLINFTSGNDNTAVGYRSLKANTTGKKNTAVGVSSLYQNTTGEDNMAIGTSAMFANTTGFSNTAVGTQSLNKNTTGEYNTAVGQRSLYWCSYGDKNTCVGYFAGYSIAGAYSNVGIGYKALELSTAHSTTAVGSEAMPKAVYGDGNTAIGMQSLYSLTGSGARNTAVGSRSMYSSTTPSVDSTGIGWEALYSATSGDQNTAVGSKALHLNTTGYRNVALGKGAGDAITTGSNNTIIGDYAGTSTLADTVVIAAGTTERLKIDSTGLSVNGAAVGGGGLIHISTVTATNVAEVDIDSDIDSTYDEYLIIGSGLYGATATTSMNIKVKIGGSWVTSGYYSHHQRTRIGNTSYDYGGVNNSSRANNVTGGDLRATSTLTGSLEIRLHNPSLSQYHHVEYEGCTSNSSSQVDNSVGGKFTTTTQGVLSGVRIHAWYTNFYGTFRLYGITKG